MPDCVIELPKFHAKQQLAFETEATDLLFGGATRGGKSFWLRKSLILWCSQIPGLQCDIFRLHFDDVIANHMEGDNSFPELLNNWVKGGLVKINQTEVKFWNGSLISLEHCADDKVMMKHQGIAKHVRCFEEATQIPERRIRWLSQWVTMSADMQARVPEKWKGRFPKVIHTSNPIGPSAGYYRRNYVKARPKYKVEEVGAFRRQYIPALVTDNPSENAETTRLRITELGDPAIADALLNENWDALVGEFYPEWDEDRHVVKDFVPPQHWFRFRTFDWGVAEPFACYWVAVSDGEPFRDREGKQRWFPRGALIFYQEWYGCEDTDPAKGIRMRNEDVARGILQRSELNNSNIITLADSKPFQDMGGDGIANTFQRCGVVLTLADTSRVAGWSQMRSRLIGVELSINQDNSTIRVPMIFFCESCKYARDYIPALGRHPSEAKKEDAQEHGEATHACDAIRYACMAYAVIRDRVEPVQSRIEREIKETKKRNNMNAIIKQQGMGYRL